MEVDGLEEEVGSAITPDRLAFDEDAPVGAEAVLGEWGSVLARRFADDVRSVWRRLKATAAP